MRKRLILLLVMYVALYFLLHIAYDLPNLVNGRSHFLGFTHGLGSLINGIMNIAVYFLFALVPYLLLFRFYPRRVFVFVLLTLLSLVVLFYFCYVLEEWKWNRDLRLKNYFLENIFYAFMFVVYGIVFFFIRYAQHKELEQKDMVIQNRQSELSFLRSQINPHFLFNSLHNIYSLMYQNSAGAQEAILGLSDLLRYMLYDASEKVPLQKEIEYIDRYIALQRIRFDHPVHAPMHITGDTSGMQIPPLLLIPFVENAFKHGDLTEAGDGVSITIHAGNRNIYFHCVNKKGHGLKDAVGGIGLQNVKRRLELLYPDRHVLKVKVTETHFTINLEVTNEQ
ncbi:sensor histidine kinase [Paraflavitalea sp. CAU 1676]|uniref:sensor histidine kinase n=1 Tax=Paraflavitalea sp. CAU 1676 TaxID=3032598 RepID=UPI0023DAB0BB|nr:sensor histidine kinase [Paraflavitalea sp. CAU 1676]MDF2188581.1 sensor histidine kinase [Paraflavitalea sp. CAU 1676]